MGWMIEMFYTDMGREVIFKEDEVTSTNIFSHELMSFKLEEPFQGEGKRIRTPPEFKGIEPGVIVKMREERPFVDWVKENMNNKASEMGMKMNMEVIAEENGVMHLWVKEYRYGPVKIKDIEAIMQLKGPTKQTYQLFIDDKLCCSWEAEIYYSAKKSIGGETIEEILEKGSIELYKDETSYS
jgi:hypothetical protein